MTTAAKRKIAVAITAFGRGLIVAVFLSREPMETLSADGLANARQRWHDSAVTGYDLRYTMNRSEYVVCVRDGIVTEADVVPVDWLSAAATKTGPTAACRPSHVMPCGKDDGLA